MTPAQRVARWGLLVLPAIVALYTVAFVANIATLSNEARIYPLVMLTLLMTTIAVVVVREVRATASAAGPADAEPGTAATSDGRGERDVLRAVWTGWRLGVVVVVIFTVYAFALPWLGFYVATAAFVVAVRLVMGGRTWRVLLGVPAVLVPVYVLFGRVLDVPLPIGRWMRPFVS